MTIINWNTTKTPEGYAGIVYEIVPLDKPINGRHAKQRLLKTVVRPTRAQAKSAALKWVRYFKAAA